MDKLEFEIYEPSGIIPTGAEEKSIGTKSVKAEDEQSKSEREALAIKFSSDVMLFLEKEMKAHNKGLPKARMTTLAQLKKVYRNGAKIFADIYIKSFPEKNCNLWALARVSMFLRMKKGEAIESSQKDIEIRGPIDISESWLPLEEDFAKAKADIKEHGLDHKFKDVEELYLEEYKKVDMSWQ